MKRRLAAGAFALCACIAAWAPVAAAGAAGSNLALAQSIVTAGGGAGSFSSATLFDVLSENNSTSELVALTKKFGAAEVRSFFTTFDFLVADVVRRLGKSHVHLAAGVNPDPGDGRALAQAMYAAGTATTQSFDSGVMLDHIVPHPFVQAAAKDAADVYGMRAMQQYRAVFAQLMRDLKTQYKL